MNTKQHQLVCIANMVNNPKYKNSIWREKAHDLVVNKAYDFGLEVYFNCHEDFKFDAVFGPTFGLEKCSVDSCDIMSEAQMIALNEVNNDQDIILIEEGKLDEVVCKLNLR